MKLLAVTVLTSYDDADLADAGFMRRRSAISWHVVRRRRVRPGSTGSSVHRRKSVPFVGRLVRRA